MNLDSCEGFGVPSLQRFSSYRTGGMTVALYALAILPALMQLVQTLIRFGAPLTSAFTACKFTFQRRRVTLCA